MNSMYTFIAEIIDRFPGRNAGSPAEHDAQIFILKKLENFCTDVREHHFRTSIGAKFGSLKLFCIVFYISLILYFVSLPAAALLALLNVIFFMGHFVTYGAWLDFLFPKQASINISATLEPQGHATSTLILSGHADCVYEFKWWYKWGQNGIVLTLASGFLFAFSAVFFVIAWYLQFAGYSNPSFFHFIWACFALLSPVTITMFSMHGSNVVDGAIDNLSGVAIAMETFGSFAHPTQKGKSILKNTRIRFVSFGSEECGLKGSKAYANEFQHQLKGSNATLINIDSVRDAKQLRIATEELNPFVKFPPDLVNEMETAFNRCAVPVKRSVLTVGATDATSFMRKGIPSLSIIGMDTDQLDPTYHTRRDTLANLDPESLEITRKVLVNFIEEWDKTKGSV